MTLEELGNRLDDAVAALERIADALEEGLRREEVQTKEPDNG